MGMDPLPSAIMSLLLSTAAGALLQIVPIIKLGFFPPQFHPRLVWEMVRFGIKGYSTEAFELILISIGPLMLSFWSTPSDVGFFSVSMRIADLFTMMPASLVPPLIPILYGTRGESLQRFSVTLIKSILLFMFICAVTILPFTGWIMSTIFGSSFLPAGKVLAALLPGYVFYSLYNIFKHYMLSENRGGYLSICAGIAVVSTVILSFFLIPAHGAVGAAVALSCGMGLLILLLLRRYCRDQHLSFISVIVFNRTELSALRQGIMRKIRGRTN
jgi:O-antigen/teichoic acid export membrane protein